MTEPALHLFPESVASTVVETALSEDLGGFPGTDVTTSATIPATQRSTAHVVAREDGVVAGMPLLSTVFRAVTERLGSPEVDVEPRREDGDVVRRGDVLAVLHGSTRAILVGERTLLNLLSRLSGVATHTRRWADALEGTGAMVLDTRKTTPGLRALEKYAVRCGGGTNKRMGLYDVAMIKDNHKLAAGSLTAAYDAVRSSAPGVDIQVEVTTTAEALEAVGGRGAVPALRQHVGAAAARDGAGGAGHRAGRRDRGDRWPDARRGARLRRGRGSTSSAWGR